MDRQGVGCCGLALGRQPVRFLAETGIRKRKGMRMKKLRWGGVVAWCLSALCAATMLLPAQKVYAAEGNLALNKNAVADSQEADSVKAKNATDGDTTSKSSRWGSAVDASHGEHWIYVDLGKDEKVSSAKVYWEARKATGFKIQVAKAEDAKDNDSTKWTWKDVYTTTERPKDKTSVINFDTTSARYVRLLITGFTGNDPYGDAVDWDAVSIYELEVYADKQTETPDEPTTEATNLALKKATKASKDYHNKNGARAVDGKKESKSNDRWMTETAPTQWLRVDLGKEETIKHFNIQWEDASNYATKFEVYVSNDESVWNAEGDNYQSWGAPVVNEQNNTKGLNEITLKTPATGRYLLLRVTGMSTGYGVSCMEFEAWNQVPAAPEKQPADYLNDIKVAEVTADTKTLSYTLPEDVPEGYKIKYNGTDYEQVIDLNGTIYRPISDVTVKASFKIENTKDNTDYAFKEFDVKVPGSMTAKAEANAAPQVLPELREWVGGEGQFAASVAKRVVYGQDSLKVMAEDFAADFQIITGVKLEVVQGAAAQAGDIFFTLGADKVQGLKDEGYLLEASANSITVKAEAVAGANWGGKTILQGMKTGNSTFPVGTTRDYPLYKVRGLILDVGRKTFTLDWLKQMTEQMAWFKLNDFQIHLNDNYIPLEEYTKAGKDVFQAYSGFRLESDIKKGGNDGKNQADLTSTDVWYTKADFKEYIEHSKALGVNIIPEIDTPAHSLALTKVRPDLRHGTDGRQNDHLNLTTLYNDSLKFVQSIFDEYVKGGENAVFAGSDVIHIGADEYSADGNAYRTFVNDMFKYAEGNGKTARVWGSLTSIKGTVNVSGISESGQRRQMNLWNPGWADLKQMYDLGFELIDCQDGVFYVVPNATYYYDYLGDAAYTDGLNSISGYSVPAGDPQMIGGAFAVWNDMCDNQENGMSEYDIYDRINRSAGLFGANSWGKSGSIDTAAAKETVAKLGDAPGSNFGYDVATTEDGTIAQWNMDDLSDASGLKRDLVEGENAKIEKVDGRSALKLNGGESYVSVKDDALTTLGLGSDLRVKVKRTSASTDEQVLFESEYGAIKAVQKDTGKVGITRENRDYSFNYTLPVDEWVELEFKNEFEVTTLYVNGEKVETIGSTGNGSRGKLKATCMLPVNTLGSATNAFEGYVDDVRVTEASEEPLASTMPLDYAVITAEKVLAEQDVPGLRALLEQAYALFLNANPAKADIDNLVAQINALLTDQDGKPSYEVADYCRLDAYAQLQLDGDAAALLNELFTDASVARVQAAWAQVRENLPAGMQSTVDSYESAVVSALDALELKTGGDLTLVDQGKLAATANSEQTEGENGKASNVLDGNLGTYWHSMYSPSKPSGPHSITLTSKEDVMTLGGLVYTARSGHGNGTVLKYTVMASEAGTDESMVEVAKGSLKDADGAQTITFDKPVRAKAIKLVVDEGKGGFGSAAELNLINADVKPDYTTLQTLVDAAKAIQKDGSCEHDAFTAETWDALQAKIAEAEKVIADQSGDVNSVFALKGELAQAIESLRLDEKTADPDEDEFIVTFDDRIPGHEDRVIVVKRGDKVPVQPMPELAGYLFDGWFTDGYKGGWKNKWDFDTPVTSDLMLTAKWVEDGDAPVAPETPDDPSDEPGANKPNGGLPTTGDNSMLLVVGVGAAAVIAVAAGAVMIAHSRKTR